MDKRNTFGYSVEIVLNFKKILSDLVHTSAE